MSEYPGLDMLSTRLSALTTRIEALEFNSGNVEIPIPETIEIRIMPDGPVVTYRKD